MKGSLLKAELHRFRRRRFIVVLLLAAFAIFMLIVTISSTQYSKPSAAGLADAKQRAAAFVEEQRRAQAECLTRLPPGQNPESFCGPGEEPSDVRVENFVDKRPFILATQARTGATGVAAGTAVLLFLIGATWVGAEWSTKTMVALLFWEPRRVKVITTKLGVLLGAAAAIAVATQALWLLAARILAATRGTSSGLPHGFYGDLLALQGRGVVLGVLAAAFGFAIANLVRNTGAALGVAFVYFVILENAVRVLRPHWQPWLLSLNIGALMSRDGIRTTVQADFPAVPREILLSNLHGGLVLGVAAGVLVTIGIVLFSRRDLH